MRSHSARRPARPPRRKWGEPASTHGASHSRHAARLRRHAHLPDAPAMNPRAHFLKPCALLAVPFALFAPCAVQAADTIVVGLRPGAVVATALSASGAVQVGAVPRLRAVVVRLPATRRS